MEYKNIYQAVFINRINRFIAEIEIEGKREICHVKNTGRCKELLIEGSKIFVEKSMNPERKTAYDLISVYKNDVLFNIDSIAPNKVFGESILSIFPNAENIKSEVKYSNSRFDFAFTNNGKKAFAEVKGVTLEKDGMALFPDAPTLRGIKHLNELCLCKKEGFEAYAVFILAFKGADIFMPNRETHPEFAKALINAEKCGVNLLAFDCNVSENSITLDKEIKISTGMPHWHISPFML